MQDNTFATLTSSWRRLWCGVYMRDLVERHHSRQWNTTWLQHISQRSNEQDIGGGVLVGIKSDLEASHRPDLERPNCELVVVQLKQTNSKPVTLYTFYRPPNVTPDALHELNDSLQSKSENDDVVVVGDLIFLAWHGLRITQYQWVQEDIWKIIFFVNCSMTIFFNSISQDLRITSEEINWICCYVTNLN
jgi:hypothetical protein